MSIGMRWQVHLCSRWCETTRELQEGLIEDGVATVRNLAPTLAPQPRQLPSVRRCHAGERQQGLLVQADLIMDAHCPTSRGQARGACRPKVWDPLLIQKTACRRIVGG